MAGESSIVVYNRPQAVLLVISMKSSTNNVRCVWTVSKAKTHLSEVLRRAEQEGPQQIGKRRPFIVVPARQWNANSSSRKPMGKWLVDNMPRGVNLDSNFDRKTGREIPFLTGETE